MRDRFKRYNSQPEITYCEMGGVEFDPVNVWIDASPEEPDVNWGGSFEVTGVEHKGVDLMPRMSDDEINSLQERLYQDACDAQEDERY